MLSGIVLHAVWNLQINNGHMIREFYLQCLSMQQVDRRQHQEIRTASNQRYGTNNLKRLPDFTRALGELYLIMTHLRDRRELTNR